VSIKRFPRLYKDYPNVKMLKWQRRKLGLVRAYTSRAYDRLSKRQKKVIRLVISGLSVREACRRIKMHPNTYYHLMNYHKLFKKFYLKYAESQLQNIEAKLDAKLGRAVRVVEDAMDSPDTYFAHDAATKLLTGRGYYKRHGESNVKKDLNVQGGVEFKGKIKTETPAIDKEVVMALVDGMKAMALGGAKRVKNPKVIDMKIVKSLPEPAKDAIPEVQKEEEK
jgi:hypothetical protein